MIKNIKCKLGNMRKVVDWVIYPPEEQSKSVIIQSDRRIARVFLDKNVAMLSDGKGGHQGFHKLSPTMGAMVVDVPEEIVKELREKYKNGTNWFSDTH